MRHWIHWLQNLFVPAAAGVLLLLGAPAGAQTVNYSPGTLSFSPSGPYSVPRDAAAGSKVASALAAATAGGISCALIETATVNGTEVAAGSGIYQTSVSGIGVSFYVVNGATQTLITSASGGYTSGTISAPGSGPLPGIQANLVVTGQVLAGFSLTGLPSVAVTFTPTGSCSWSSGITTTLATSASNSSVVPITCTVTTPTVSVNMPTASLSALNAFGKTAGDTRFPIGLSCASGANVYITLSDATTPANTTSLLTLASQFNRSGHQAAHPQQCRTGGIRTRFGRGRDYASMVAGRLEQRRWHSTHGAVLPR